MIPVWLIITFNYYLIQFLINTFDEVYKTGLMSSGAEITGMVGGGLFLQILGIKKSLALSFGFSLLGAILVMSYGLTHQESVLFPVFILFMKFGVSAAFNIIYIAHPMIFPVLFAATALGLCNFTSRIFTGISPILAQME